MDSQKTRVRGDVDAERRRRYRSDRRERTDAVSPNSRRRCRRRRRRLSIFVDGCRPSRAQQSRRRRRHAVPYRRGRGRCIDIGNGGRTVTRVFTTTSGKTRAIIGRDCAYRGSGPVIVAGEEIFFVYIELPRQLTYLVIVCAWVGVLCDVV